MFLAVTNCPADFGGIRFRPPAVQLRKVQTTVDEDLHSTGSAGFPRAPRRVDPQIDTLDYFLCQEHVVVTEEDHTAADLRMFDKVVPLLDQCLSGQILRMSFPGENQLQRTLLIGKERNQPFRIVQEKIGALIGGKSARKSHGQHIFIKDAAGIGRSPIF